MCFCLYIFPSNYCLPVWECYIISFLMLRSLFLGLCSWCFSEKHPFPLLLPSAHPDKVTWGVSCLKVIIHLCVCVFIMISIVVIPGLFCMVVCVCVCVCACACAHVCVCTCVCHIGYGSTSQGCGKLMRSPFALCYQPVGFIITCVCMCMHIEDKTFFH